MPIDQAIFRHDDLDLPDPALHTLPDDWVPKLTFFTDNVASTATAVTGGAASLAAAREDRFRAKADLDKGESQSVVDSSITKKHLDALRDRLTRAVKREKVAEADDARTRRIHADAQQPVVSTTRLLNSARTFTPPPENSGVVQTIADRGWITGYDLKRVEVDLPAGAPTGIASRQRAALIDLKAELVIEESAPPKPDTVKRVLRSQVESASARGKVGFSTGDGERRGPSLDWPRVALPAEPAMNSNGDRVRVIDAESMLCRFFGDQIIAELEAAVDEQYATTEVTRDPHEKARNIKAIKAKILQAERIECAAIWKLIESGDTSIAFRPDTNPRAILGVE